jgi:hypothetical protein
VQDLIVDANEEYRATVLESHPNLRDGILLLKVWLKQRGLDQVSSLNLLFFFWVTFINGTYLFVHGVLIPLCCGKDTDMIETAFATLFAVIQIL